MHETTRTMHALTRHTSHALSRSVSYAAEITLNTSTASALLTVSIPVLATRSGWSASYDREDERKGQAAARREPEVLARQRTLLVLREAAEVGVEGGVGEERLAAPAWGHDRHHDGPTQIEVVISHQASPA